MQNPWRAEFSLLLVALLISVFLGKLLNQPLLVPWIMLLAYLCHHLIHANRLLRWLQSGKASQAPKGMGIWEDIYYLISRVRRRNRRRKKELIRMLERFRTATAALPDATVVLSAGDQIDWFNDAAGKLLGLRRGDIGQKIGNLLRYPKFTHYLEHGDYRATVGIPCPVAENIQLDVRLVPYGENLRLLVAQDVTQLRFMERVRTDFVANVSHELRTPLTVVRGYVESLVDNAGDLPASYQRVFQRMEEQTLRMQHLIDDLLTLTRLESAAHSMAQNPVDVPSMLKNIHDEALLVAMDNKPEIKLSVASDAWLLGSERELHSAFSNLVQNALKYCGAGDHVLVRWHDEGPGARLDVSDTGPGIAPEYIPRLTERFYRVDQGRGPGGTGLGLAIVKHVIARHGAEFKITSTLGEGSCFSCCFPGGRVIHLTDEADDASESSAVTVADVAH